MHVVGEESATMSRAFLMKKTNYSHCPLKKRPVHIFKDDSADSQKGKYHNLLSNIHIYKYKRVY